MANPPWAPEEEDQRLQTLASSGASVAEMAKQMKRSEEAVQPCLPVEDCAGQVAQVEAEGEGEGEGEMKPAPGLKGRAWTAEDDDRLKSLIEAGVSMDLIAAKMKRTTQGVRHRAGELRISTKRVWVRLKAKGK
jgi:hypothetical protein